MRIFKKFNQDSVARALESVGGDTSLLYLTDTLESCQRHDAFERAHQIGVIAGNVIELEAYKKRKQSIDESPATQPERDASFRHVTIVHPEPQADHEIS